MEDKNQSIDLTFLGTGTSTGVPVVACQCDVCTSNNKKDKRLRTSALLKIGDKTIVIDCGPDFRMQMLNNAVSDIDAILFTHAHRDHIAGLDDIRGYNYILNKKIDVFATREVFASLNEQFPYIFNNTRYFGAPQINENLISHQPFDVYGVKVTPIKVWHHKMEVLGFRIKDFTYITDASEIPAKEMDKIKGSRIVVINALRKSHHVSHLSLDEAIEIIKTINPEKAYITHMSHFIGKHEEVEKDLPSNVFLAYDNLNIKIDSNG